MLSTISIDDEELCREYFGMFINFALEIHATQRDRGGRPYSEHLFYVAQRQPTFAGKVLGLLHDSIEDDKTTRHRLVEIGCPESVIARVELLDRRGIADYTQYIQLLGQDEVARLVKLADLEHNMQPHRLPVLRVKDLARIQKYHQAYLQLKEIGRGAQQSTT